MAPHYDWTQKILSQEEGSYTKFYLDLPIDSGWELDDD
jgi:hypothetical protein